MDKFSSNPLSGITTDKKYIKDADGNVLMQRIGREWSENDQLGYDILMKSMDYDYQADLLNYQNWYNSPEQQAKRLREAGMNPDLQQISGHPSASSSASAPDTQFGLGEQYQKTQFALQTAQQFIQLIPQAVDIYQSVKNFGLQNQMNEISVLKGVQDLGDQAISQQFTLDDLNSKVSLPQANLSHIKSRKLQAKVDDYIFGLVSDPSNRDYAKGLVYDVKKSAEGNRQGFLSLLGQYGFNVDDDLFVGVLREFNDVLFGSQKSKHQYDKDYYSNISGVDDATLHTEQTSKSTKLAENDIMADLMSRANKKIDSSDKKDQMVGVFMYIILSLMQGSVSYGRGPKGSTFGVGFN